MQIQQIQALQETNPELFILIIILIALWVLPWKGYALWRASKNGHSKWFVAIFLINTMAILDIIYIFFVDKKKRK
ncbi:hypothetical protein A2442_00925 [Candidatus Campbellbacteria bacterium RIFOXYC2_FULL_35_25]|uniref:DUF5652 domain-containing protein n=1 Tax=Candidatus Campbellbacteria bacterium RIFOXYC2_FULL_35_25 TaxID=1797582 RepID=A0A1F5EIW3_9BACT|nr:MAG: hypothetical protein A2442_00925 [Candidatus Campbellbacteria bacterium RIFOXYC2_FULL_35_25]